MFEPEYYEGDDIHAHLKPDTTALMIWGMPEFEDRTEMRLTLRQIENLETTRNCPEEEGGM